MRANLGEIYNEVVSVIHRIDAKEAGTRYDHFTVNVYQGCMWSETSQRSVSQDGTVTLDLTRKVQIPSDQSPVVALGDFICKGEISEAVTAGNVREITASLPSFQAKDVRNLAKNDGFACSPDGVLRFAECTYIEG